MMSRIYLVLFLACANLLALQIEQPSILIYPDSFYPLEHPDPQLEKLLANLFRAVDTVKDDKQALMLMLKTQNQKSTITALSSYLAEHKYMKEMRENIHLEVIIFCHQQWNPTREEDIQILTLNILESILKSSRSIEFIKPVLTRFEKYIYATKANISNNIALEFFFLSVINKIILPLCDSRGSGVESSQLMMRMLSNVNFTNKHEAFLKKQSNLGQQAFKLLDTLSERLVSKPRIDNYVIYLLNCTPMGTAEREIAQMALSKQVEF